MAQQQLHRSFLAPAGAQQQLQCAPVCRAPCVTSRQRLPRRRPCTTRVLEREAGPSSAVVSSLQALLPPSLVGRRGSSVPAEQQRESEQAARAHSEHTQQQQQQQQQQRVLTCREGEVFYFSYGANLSLSTLKRRAVAPTSRSPAFVRDPAVRLVFKHRGGYSTLQQLDAQAAQQVRYRPYMEHVHGVVYALTTADLQALAKKEGGYQVVDIQVETYDGFFVTAKTFVSSPLALLPTEVAPTERYAKLLREGAAENYLDPLYQAWLSSIDTVPSAGLPHEYFNSPSKYVGYAFLAIVALLVVGFFAQ